MNNYNKVLPKLVSEEEEAFFKKEFEGGPKFVKRPSSPAQDNEGGQGYWSPGREDEQLRLTGVSDLKVKRNNHQSLTRLFIYY